MKMHISREKLKKKLLKDPDLENDAGNFPEGWNEKRAEKIVKWSKQFLNEINCGVVSIADGQAHNLYVEGASPFPASRSHMKQQYVLKVNSDPLLAGKRKFWDLIYKEGKGYSSQTVWTFSEKSLIALRDEIEKVLKRKQ